MCIKQTYFRNDWFPNPDFKNWWRHGDSKTAFRDKCNKTMKLSNMVEQALRSKILKVQNAKNI